MASNKCGALYVCKPVWYRSVIASLRRVLTPPAANAMSSGNPPTAPVAALVRCAPMGPMARDEIGAKTAAGEDLTPNMRERASAAEDEPADGPAERPAIR